MSIKSKIKDRGKYKMAVMTSLMAKINIGLSLAVFSYQEYAITMRSHAAHVCA